MILVDALYINNSGGKVLLDYLIEELEVSGLHVFYLLDDRVSSSAYTVKQGNIIYLKASLINRFNFYRENKDKFTKVFCFGNLPPLHKLNIPVYTYFHQKLFIDEPKELPLKQKIVFKVKVFIFRQLMRNTRYWIVQTEAVKKDFLNAFAKIDNEQVLVIPFYPQLTSNNIITVEREEKSFVYVSNGSPHKNHERLIKAFVEFFQVYKVGKLYLTIGTEFPILQTLIKNYKEEGFPIINVGFLDRHALEKLYKTSEFLIFPSLSESFGLGLLEAMENGCKIVGANLDYTFAVCNPSLVFEPNSVHSITDAFIEAATKDVKLTEQLVFNEINKLIEILKNNENTK